MTVLRGGAATDVGRVRSNNQDQLLVAGTLYAVADGMGGHAGGEVASLAAVEALQAAFDENPSADGLADAVRNANQVVWNRAQEGRELRGMGTTLTAVALVEGEREDDDLLAVVNVGDSRAYLLRDGELEQLTEDHSVPEELRRAGRLSDAEAAAHPQRNVLTRALGIDPNVEVDCFEVTPFKGDRILLSSDGLYNEVDEPDIVTVLRRVGDPEDAARELVAMAREHGGNDNITVVVVDVADDGSRSARASAAVATDPVRQGGSRRRRREAGPVNSSPAEAVRAARPRIDEPELASVGAPRSTTSTPPDPSPSPAGRAAGASFPRSSDITPSRRDRRVTPRAAVFVGLVLLVLLAGLGATAWYGRGGYFVGVAEGGDSVAIFKGRPGGLLWFNPTLAERTELSLAEVLPHQADVIRAGKEYGSIDAARRFVTNVTEEAAPTTTTTTTTTLPLPPGPTTTGVAPAPPPAQP
ncbi:MAG TPA: Stp1/IreP family PP2C-type Ser/Thr phosphatase [Acidimicrobiales bacterium]|nr:Stp1/IreP family PP2C-type Ser/Thr phosphatase [Acidimicrobiales bacterium]